MNPTKGVACARRKPAHWRWAVVLTIALAIATLDIFLPVCGTVQLRAQAVGNDPARPLMAVLRVQLSEQSANLPVSGALVSVLDGHGATVIEALTNAQGVRFFGIRDAGQYRVHVRRIGYLPFTSDPVTLTLGDTARLALSIPSIPVTLPTVQSTASTKACRRGEGEQLQSSVLWDQIRTALEASQVTTKDSSVRTLRRNYTRGALPKGGPPVLLSTSQTLNGVIPFQAPRSAAQLSSSGYVWVDSGATVYASPDATVLLSPEFENDHCFSVIAGSGPTSGLIGLSFAPVSDRKLADITGVLWVAGGNTRLEYLEYHYVNFHPPSSADGAGARVVFERLPGGEWIVRDYVIHMPGFARYSNGVVRLAGYLDVGGSAEAVTTEAPRSSTSAMRLRVADGPTGAVRLQSADVCPDSATHFTMTVTDSVGKRALVSAMVAVSWFDSTSAGGTRSAIGLPYVAVAGADGIAHMCLPPHAGQPFAVAYANGLMSAAEPVSASTSAPPETPLGADGRTSTHAFVPDRSSGIDAVIRDSSGAPIEGAEIEVNGRPNTETSNKSGRLSLRDLEPGVATLDVWRAGYGRQHLAVDLTPKGKAAIEIRLAGEGG